MRLKFFAAFAVLGLVWAGEARAQFANKSIGLSLGVLDMQNVSQSELGVGFPIGLVGTLYIENGFEVVVGAGIMVVHDQIQQQNILALDGPSAGIKYLFKEESFRPYVGLDLSYLHLFGSLIATADFVGLGPNAGFDYFVSDSISVGLRGRFNVYISLNAIWWAPSANLNVSTYF